MQAQLARNGRTGGREVRNRFGAILKGLLRCRSCAKAMSPSHSSKNRGKTRYRYYVCSSAQKRGWATCPTKSVPAAVIEEAVIGQLKRIGEDPASTFPEFGLSFPQDWSTLTPRDQLRILPELIESIDYDGPTKRIAIHFRVPERTEPQP